MKTLCLLPLLIACSGVAYAQAAPAVAPPTAPAAKTSSQDKVICHTEEQIGTKLGGHKECHTRREWDEMARDSRASVDWNNRQLGQGPH